MQVKILDPGKILPFLSSGLRRQVPHATSKTLNTLAFDFMRHMRAKIPLELDTTNQWLVRSTQVERATKSAQRAEVGWGDRVYFGERLVEGGVRTPLDGKYIAVPIGGGSRRRRRSPSELLSRRGYYIFEINGRLLIAKASQTKVQASYVLVERTIYDESPYFNMPGLVDRFWQSAPIAEIMQAELLRALR